MTGALEVDTVVGGRYRLVARRDFGSSADAFQAEDLRGPGVQVVIEPVRSLVPSSAALASIERARSLSRSVAVAAPLVDVIEPSLEGASADGWLLVYALPAGETLAERAARIAQGDSALLSLGEGLLAAVERLHAAGTNHLALTPRNVWLSTSDGQTSIALIGVGLHHAATGEAGGLAHLGFWSFAAPEQLSPSTRADANNRADVYAVATILFKLWSGELPHRAKNALELVEARRKSPPRPLSEVLGRRLRHSLDVWFLNALAASPSDRPTAAQALASFRDEVRAGAAPMPDLPTEDATRMRQLDVLSELCERLSRGEPPLPTDVFLSLLSELERRGDLEAVARAWEAAGEGGRIFVPGPSAETIASSEVSALAKADIDALDPDDRRSVNEAIARVMLDPVLRGVEPLGDERQHLRVRAGAVRVLYVVRGGVLLVVRVRRGF